jgi:hypothetical protein
MTGRFVLAVLAAVVLAAMFVSAANASCVRATVAEQRARADVIFDGVAIEGPTSTGVQRFRVTGYMKGGGPRVVRVQTGTVKRADGSGSVTSVGISVRRDERWLIFAEGSPRKVLRTSVCAGSRKR